MKFLRSTVFVACVLATFIAPAQTNKYTMKGNIAFEKMYWAAAIENYQLALKKEKDNEQKQLMTYRIAKSFEYTRDMKNATSWYEKVIKNGGKFVKANPQVYLDYANALKKMEMYKEAMEQYMTYQGVAPNDSNGVKGAKSCELAMKWIEKPTRYLVENVVQLNTKYNDAIPVFAHKKKNEIVFQSYRSGATGTGENDVWGEPFPDLYSSSVDRKSGEWKEPERLGEPVNTEFAEGGPAFNGKYNTLFYTRCENHEKEVKGCDIYMATKKGTSFADPVKLDLFPNDSTATVVAHPFITKDDEKLYFVSNAAGGKGGYDIWVATWDNKAKQYLNPQNVTSVNTAGQEIYPFIHEDGTLYFSSNGHVGMGGFDLFKAEFTGGNNFGPVLNLKYPLNSSADDVSIIFEDDYERGFLTSNRAGSKGGADIWSFVLPAIEIFVEGTVTECNGGPVPNAKVTLKGSNDTQAEIVTGADGKFKFQLEIGVMYSLKAKSDSTYKNALGTEKLKYFASDVQTVDVVAIDDSKTFKVDPCLEPIPEKGIELPNIVYEYNKATLTADAKNKLKELIKTMNDNPTLVIELGSHTDFRGGDEYNRRLAQRRAQSVVDYLTTQGIDKERMEAKGYGEDVPKNIDSTVFSKLTPNLQQMFPVGTQLTEKYITSLKDNVKVEAAHQLNRRTEFKVLRTDYVPKAEGDIKSSEEGAVESGAVKDATEE